MHSTAKGTFISENLDNSSETVTKDENFFDKIQQEAKETTTKEKIKQKRKEREANIEEVITISQYQVEFCYI